MASYLLPSQATSAIFEIELFTYQNCQPYEHSWTSALLSLMRYVPHVITFVLYFAGLRYKELYLLLFGVGLTISSSTNQLLNGLLGAPLRVSSCVALHGPSISWQAQQAAFFVMFSLAYASLYQARLKLWHAFALELFLALAVIAQEFLNYHTPQATIAGAALGIFVAVLWQLFLYAVIVPSFSIVLRSTFVQYMAYQDTLCYDWR